MGCSTFSNHSVLPEIALAKIRKDAPFDKACYIGCGVTTGVGAVLFTAKVEAGANVVVFGLGGIGQRIARLAKAFDMTVLAMRRDPSKPAECVDELHPDSALIDLLPRADAVVLACPLTPATEKLIGPKALAAMKPDAYLVNVARGRVVDEAALIATLQAGRLAGAALDVTEVEPLAPESPLWDFANVLITPHTGGETRFYEDDVVRVLLDNVGRLQRGESQLRNQIV
jgi:phosphoglycerate dehydrogenase-like enzyme